MKGFYTSDIGKTSLRVTRTLNFLIHYAGTLLNSAKGFRLHTYRKPCKLRCSVRAAQTILNSTYSVASLILLAGDKSLGTFEKVIKEQIKLLKKELEKEDSGVESHVPSVGGRLETSFKRIFS